MWVMSVSPKPTFCSGSSFSPGGKLQRVLCAEYLSIFACLVTGSTCTKHAILTCFYRNPKRETNFNQLAFRNSLCLSQGHTCISVLASNHITGSSWTVTLLHCDHLPCLALKLQRMQEYVFHGSFCAGGHPGINLFAPAGAQSQQKNICMDEFKNQIVSVNVYA